MRVFLRHFYRDFLRAPIYPLLLLFTLSFAVAVTVTASGVYRLIISHTERVSASDIELGDIAITPGAAADVRFLFPEDAQGALGEDAEVLGEFALSGAITVGGERYLLTAAAVDLLAADAFYDFTYTAYGRFSEDTLDSTVILSESFAARTGLAVGDSFHFELLNSPVTYTVGAIAKDTGLLAEREMLLSLHGVLHLLSARVPAIAALGDGFAPATRLLVRTDAPNEAMAALSDAPALSDAYIRLCTNTAEGDFLYYVQSVAILLVTVLLLVLTAILSVTATRLLFSRRRIELALFAAAGASRRQTHALLFAEGGVYALLASFFGTLLSIPILRRMGEIFPWQGKPLTPSFYEIAVGVLFAFGFTALCVWLALLGEKSLPLAARLTDVESAERRGRRAAAYAALALSGVVLICLLLIDLLPIDHRMPPAVVGMVSLAFALLFGVPYLLYGVAALLSRLLAQSRLPASLRLSYENLKGHFSLRHTGRLFAVTLAVCIGLFLVQDTFRGRVEVSESLLRADYVMAHASAEMTGTLEKSDGVLGGEFGYYEGIELQKDGYAVYGLSVGDAVDCFDSDFMPKELPRGNEICLSEAIAALFGLSAGDALTISYKGNDYEVVLSEHFAQNSPVVFFDAEFLGLPHELYAFSFTEGADREATLAYLSAEGALFIPAEDVVNAGDMIDSFIEMLDLVLGAAILLSVVGIFNALLPMYRGRRHSLAILRLSGLSRAGLARMLTLELLLTFALSLLLALCGGTAVAVFINAGLSSFGVTL